MKSKREIGAIGEKHAENYLKRRGWKILSNNYTVYGGEIDLVGYRFGVLAFFEVKSRSNDEFGSPALAVDAQKIKNIKFAAQDFLKAYRKSNKIPVFYPFGIEKMQKIAKMRIDIIEVYFDKEYKLSKINHIKDREKLS